jgi:cytochrome c1
MWTALRSDVFGFWMCMSRSRVRLTIARVTRMNAGAWLVHAVALTCLFLAGCDAKSEKSQVGISGDPKRGMDLIKQYGCGGCHLIPGVVDATGNVGPPLLHVGTRTYIAGFFSNSPENMALWIQDPQRALPGNAMPRMGVTPQDARDITAFLYTLK